MNFGNYTQKSLEVIQSAQNIAVANNNQQLEQCHLLLALLRQDGGLVPQLLQGRSCRGKPSLWTQKTEN